MHFVYDFDSTLFATQKLWEAWRQILISAGYDPRDIDAIGQQITPNGYSPRKHADMLGVDEVIADEMLARFEAIMRDESPSMVFSDVVPFVEARRAAHAQSILTMGDEAHQREKLSTSGVDRLIPSVLIAKPHDTKAQHLRDMLDRGSEPIVFIDDNPVHLERVHAAKIPVELIRILRPSETTLVEGPHRLDNEAWRIIASLEELDT